MVYREVQDSVIALMEGFPAPWCIGGGWSIDLFVGKATRPHADVDLVIFRKDQRAIHRYFAEWEIRKVVHGRLQEWPEEEWLEPPVHEIHVRRPGREAAHGGGVRWSEQEASHAIPGGAPSREEWSQRAREPARQQTGQQESQLMKQPAQLEFLLNEVDPTGRMWVFRRDPRVMRPIERIIHTAEGGLPILSPAVALLYKAKDPRPHDEHDFWTVRDVLDAHDRRWLRQALEVVHPGHRWIERL